jgi:hypothetical protein
MIAIPLGLLTVPVAGEPVTITSSDAALPPNGCVHMIEVNASADATGAVFVKDRHSGNIIAELLPITVSSVESARWSVSAGRYAGNTVQLSRIALDAAVSGEGAYVTLWVK